MSVRGSLKTMSIADVFDWLRRRNLRGELTLDRAAHTRRFQVADGHVTGASSTDPAEYLGQILINAGVLTEEQLREAYASQSSDGILLGKILAVGGVVSEGALRQAIDLKIRESFYDALAWGEGTFQFDLHGDAPRPLEIEVAVPIEALVAEGTVRVETWKKLRIEIPSDECRFFVPDRGWLDKAKPGSPSALILGDVVRGLTVREICLARHALPFPIYQRLSELMARGIIQLDRRSEVRAQPVVALPAPALIDAARGRARGGDRTGALDLARQALALAPESEAIKQAYAEIERGLFAELSRQMLSRFRVPRLLKSREELAQESLSAEERYLVDRIDGRWDLLSLMRVSPLREVEALITFSRLADRGLITLGDGL
jgi:hypothetical protein